MVSAASRSFHRRHRHRITYFNSALWVALAAVDVPAFAIGVCPAAALVVDNEFEARADLIGKCYPLSQQPLFFEVLINQPLVDFTFDVFCWHIQRDAQRDKVTDLSVG